MDHVLFSSKVINGLGILAGITAAYFLLRMRHREKAKQNLSNRRLNVDDEKSLDQFHQELMQARLKQAAQYLSALYKIRSPQNCEIYGQLLFEYDDGTNLIVDLAVLTDEKKLEGLRERFIQLMKDKNAQH